METPMTRTWKPIYDRALREETPQVARRLATSANAGANWKFFPQELRDFEKVAVPFKAKELIKADLN